MNWLEAVKALALLSLAFLPAVPFLIKALGPEYAQEGEHPMDRLLDWFSDRFPTAYFWAVLVLFVVGTCLFCVVGWRRGKGGARHE